MIRDSGDAQHFFPPLSKPALLTRASLASVGRAAWFVLVPLVSSLLLTASFPPYDAGFLAWFGLAPLLFALRRTTLRGALGLSALFGALFGFEAFTWFRELKDVSLPSYLLLAFGFILYFLAFGFFYYRVSERRASGLVAAAPALWVSMEYVRANLGFLSLPWNLVGHSQYRYLPVIQVAALAGVYGLSFLIVLVNQALSQVPDWLIARAGRASPGTTSGVGSGLGLTVPALIAGGLLVLTLTYGWHVVGNADSNRTIRAAIVQANVLTRDRMPPHDQVEHLRAYQRLTREAAKFRPDLIVWPSTSLPGAIQWNRLVSMTMRRTAAESGAFILAGGAGGDKLRPKKIGYVDYSNSEFLISPAGKLVGQYNKMQLLAFNEYLPLEGYVTWPEWVTSLHESFEPGTEYKVFEVSGARFGAPICWENMFPDHFRRFVKAGAQFMVSTANEGFFGISQAPYQILAMNVFRAVENRVAVVRTTTTGISGFISPAGEILEVVKDAKGQLLFVSGFLVRDVPLATDRTFYTMYGDLFAYLAIGLAVWFVVLVYRSRRTETMMGDHYAA